MSQWKETMENSVRLGQPDLCGLEPGTSSLPVSSDDFRCFEEIKEEGLVIFMYYCLSLSLGAQLRNRLLKMVLRSKACHYKKERFVDFTKLRAFYSSTVLLFKNLIKWLHVKRTSLKLNRCHRVWAPQIIFINLFQEMSK